MYDLCKCINPTSNLNINNGKLLTKRVFPAFGINAVSLIVVNM